MKREQLFVSEKKLQYQAAENSWKTLTGCGKSQCACGRYASTSFIQPLPPPEVSQRKSNPIVRDHHGYRHFWSMFRVPGEDNREILFVGT